MAGYHPYGTRAGDAGATSYVYGGSPHWLGMIGGSVMTGVLAVTTLHCLTSGVRGLLRRRA